MSSFKDDKVPCARLCHIVKWDDFNGYGFNLHAQKGKNGQFIGKVDEGSPSLAAGLRQGDRIVEVNEIDIANETHNQVVERIKAFANETKLLVVDQEADDYFRENNIVIKGTMSNIKVIKTPERNPNSVEDRSESSNCSVDESRNQFYRDLYCRNHDDRKHKHRVACIFYLDHQELMTRQEAI
ncbi:Na(+)/H(+) exchange regulatory cofactor NHE-RF2 [Acromyrmex echinatior]|uniref:Na(+)/H(+) exchange regulatory cofactor NHE-RF2 n=1 Tax=Acromyrmex echinatior TaxID=103372 RepID=F4WE90_ACREC|nr:Na(+)/H(+) exchange regulatory cofactor NHE-RF2 [Acromyrmex echinatior]